MDFDSESEVEGTDNVHPLTFTCNLCSTRCKSKKLYLKHMSGCRRLKHRRTFNRARKVNYCQMCNVNFPSPVLLEYHLAGTHRCNKCNFEGKKDEVIRQKEEHCIQLGTGKNIVYKDIRPFKAIKAFKGYVRTYRHKCSKPYPTLLGYAHAIKPYLLKLLRNVVLELSSVKSQISFYVTFKRYLCESVDGKSVYEYQKKIINSNMLIILNHSSLTKFFNKCIAKIENTTNIFQQYGSGWQLSKITGCDVRIGTFRPFRGGCWIKVPDQLKRCTSNVKNYDNQCFKWAVLSAIHVTEVGKSYSTSKYVKFEDQYDFTCVEFPVSVSSVKKFEAVNDLAINIFSYDWKNGLEPVRISEFNYTNRKTVDLLILGHPKAEHKHYVAITDIHGLLGKTNHHRRLLCYNCMQTLPQCLPRKCKTQLCQRDCVFKSHVTFCKAFKFQRVISPSTNENGTVPAIRFTSIHKQLQAGYVIYADFESLLVKVSEKPNASYKKRKHSRKKKKKTVRESIHKTSGFSYAVIKYDGSLISHHVYRGRDAVDVFLHQIGNIANIIQDIYKVEVPIEMNATDTSHFNDATNCHICEAEFLDEESKCKDHCHMTGKYRGAAHTDCNVNFRQSKKVPVITHNFRGYDSHFVVGGFEKFGEKFSVTATNSEKYLSITVDNLIFIDSLQFMNSSLAQLVENLKVAGYERTNFDILHQIFDDESVELLKRKGVYPYEYMDSWTKFSESELPPIDDFYSCLRNEGITPTDFEHAQKVFKHFKMKTLGDYHDLYLLTDTLLLACVFENFRSLSLDIYKLDPAHYISAPGLAWDAALRKTKVELDMITDISMHEFFELGIRGGISMISHRRAEANNMYMEQYNNQIDSTYLMYLDMNNLYGIAMQQNLPVSEFRWMNEDEVIEFNIQTVDDEGDDGYILECDLSYPEEIHDEHNDYPLAPERMNVPMKNFGKYQTHLLKKLEIKYMEHQTKLIPHLGERKNYIIHSRNLKYYLVRGMKLDRIHKIVTFKQKAWLKPYIDFNTEQRKKSKNEFEKDFFKLMNNSVFGKGMENVRKRMSVQLVNKMSKAKWLISKPQYITHDILAPNLCAFRMTKATVRLDKAIYTGFSVLELSKLYMYQFHYDFIRTKYGSKAKLLMTDTDSLAYQIQTRDVYADLKQHLDLFDMSDYPTTHPLYCTTNNKVIGKMKDEAKSKILFKFVGLGPKSYCFVGSELKSEDGTFEKKALKGVPKYIQKKSIPYELLEEILAEQDKLICSMSQLRSYKHMVYTINVSKSALHGFDSKRFINDDGVSTLAWGHYQLSTRN